MASVKATSRVPNAWIRGKGFGGILFSKSTRTVLLLLNIYHLTQKMKGQLSVIDIDNDATSYVVECSLINYIPFAQVQHASVIYFLKRVGYARLS